VKRFADAGVLAAVADRAVATTLVTSEGRALTEVSLQVRNRAQPFLKVALPRGATLASVEVAGEPAKPVLGADGTRVPLLRPGFRPNGPYTVSFVYLHAGTPFARRGDLQMALPRMDLPIGIVEWEVFVPETYSVRAIDGNVIERRLVVSRESVRTGGRTGAESEKTGGAATGTGSGIGIGTGRGLGSGAAGGVGGGVASTLLAADADGLRGQIRGRVTDQSGAPLPGATVDAEVGGSHRTAVSGPDGSYLLLDVPSGPARVTARLNGYSSGQAAFAFDQRAMQANFVLSLGSLAESVTTSAKALGDVAQKQQPSLNVVNLQRRAAGVLPIRVDVPRAGTSHQFVKPLVVDQEATVSLRYRRR
jgi:hypothetical protein